MSRPSPHSGFTLTEVLIAAAIIAILAALIFAGYSSMRGKSEDAKRVSDLTELATALRLYKEDYGVYPQAGCGAFWGKGGGTGEQYASPGPADSAVHYYIEPNCDEYIDSSVHPFVPNYISVLPTDPDEDDVGAGYMYTATLDGKNYKLVAHDSASRNVLYSEPFGRCPASCPDCHSQTWTYEPSFAVYTPIMACE